MSILDEYNPQTVFNRGECDRVKRIIRNGGIATAARGRGKTTAILEIIHELGVDNCLLVVPNRVLAANALHVWRLLYEHEIGLSLSWDPRNLQGLHRYIFCDGLAQCIENNPDFGDRYAIARLSGATL